MNPTGRRLGSKTVATPARSTRPAAVLVAIGILIATLAACSTPYGGPGGCLVVGKGSCYTDGQNQPTPR